MEGVALPMHQLKEPLPVFAGSADILSHSCEPEQQLCAARLPPCDLRPSLATGEGICGAVLSPHMPGTSCCLLYVLPAYLRYHSCERRERARQEEMSNERSKKVRQNKNKKRLASDFNMCEILRAAHHDGGETWGGIAKDSRLNGVRGFNPYSR
jgi:hypothetical protein